MVFSRGNHDTRGIYAEKLAEPLILKAEGKEVLAKEKYLEFKAEFGKHELEMERCYDHYMLMASLNRIFLNITRLYDT